MSKQLHNQQKSKTKKATSNFNVVDTQQEANQSNLQGRISENEPFSRDKKPSGSESDKFDSFNRNNVSAFFGTTEDQIKEQQPSSPLIFISQEQQVGQETQVKDGESYKAKSDEECSPENATSLVQSKQISSHKKIFDQTYNQDHNRKLIKTSESKNGYQIKKNASQTIKFVQGTELESQEDMMLECGENIDIPLQSNKTTLKTSKMKKITLMTPNGNIQKKNFPQISISEYTSKRASDERKVESRVMVSGQKDLQLQAQRFLKEKSEISASEMCIQSPPFVQHGQNRITMPLDISPNLCVISPHKKVDILEALSNQNTDRFNQSSAQQQRNISNDNEELIQLKVTKQVMSFAPRLSPRSSTRCLFKSHANGQSRIHNDESLSVYDLNEDERSSNSPHKLDKIRVHPIIQRTSSNNKGNNSIGYQQDLFSQAIIGRKSINVSPSPHKNQGTPSIVGSSTKGRFLSPNQNNDDCVGTSPAAKRFQGSSNTPNTTRIYQTRTSQKGKSVIYSNFKINENSLQKICSSKQGTADNRQQSHVKKLQFGEQSINGMTPKMQNQEGRYTNYMSMPDPFFGGSGAAIQQLFSKNQLNQNWASLNGGQDIYQSPVFMNNSLRNPWHQTLNGPQFDRMSPYAIQGDNTPVFAKQKFQKNKKGNNMNDAELSQILPSIVRVGGDNDVRLDSALKSSATFISSPQRRKNKLSKSKRKNSSYKFNNNSIKIEIRPDLPDQLNIVSPDKKLQDSTPGKFYLSSKQDKNNSNLKSGSGSGSYTSDSQSSSGDQSSSEESTEKPSFNFDNNQQLSHKFRFDNGLFTTTMNPQNFSGNLGYNQQTMNQLSMMNQIHPFLQELNHKFQMIQEHQQNQQNFNCLPPNKDDIKCSCGLWKPNSPVKQPKCKGSGCKSERSSRNNINYYHKPEIIINQQNYISPSYGNITQGDHSNLNFGHSGTNFGGQAQQFYEPWQNFGVFLPNTNQHTDVANKDSSPEQEPKQKTKKLQLGKRQSTGQQQKESKSHKKVKIENPEMMQTPERDNELRNKGQLHSDHSWDSSDKNKNSKKRSKKDISTVKKSISKNHTQEKKNDDDMFDKPDSKVGANQIQDIDMLHQTPKKDAKQITVTEANVAIGISQMKTNPTNIGSQILSRNDDSNRNLRTPSSLEKIHINHFNLNLKENMQAVSADKIQFHHLSQSQQQHQFGLIAASHFNVDAQNFQCTKQGNNSITAQYDDISMPNILNKTMKLGANTAQKTKQKKKEARQTYLNQAPNHSTRRSIIEKEQQQKEKEEKIREITEKIMDETITQEQLFSRQREQDTSIACAGCKCKNNQCLKLYCICLANNATCGPECQCKKLQKDGICLNTPNNADERRKAVEDILGRNINAFKEKVNKNIGEHLTGCKCQKSECQKRYCECYERGLPCIPGKCKCENCKNVHKHPDRGCGDQHNDQSEKQEIKASPSFQLNKKSPQQKVEINLPDSLDKVDLQMNQSIIKNENQQHEQQFQQRKFKPEEVLASEVEDNQESSLKIIQQQSVQSVKETEVDPIAQEQLKVQSEKEKSIKKSPSKIQSSIIKKEIKKPQSSNIELIQRPQSNQLSEPIEKLLDPVHSKKASVQKEKSPISKKEEKKTTLRTSVRLRNKVKDPQD